MAERRDELELYVHLPFCVRKCNYCDFLSGPGYAQEPYIEAMKREMAACREACAGYRVRSVFFGGGTPTLLTEELWEEVFSSLRDNFTIDVDAEITAEGNPGTITADKLRLLRDLGVNRLSLGLQSVREEELRLLGRIHTYPEFLKTWEDARACGFTNINVDLISALPGQTPAAWLESLETVAKLSPEHISAYSLIIEEGTPFYTRYADGEGLPSEDEERQMVHETKELLSAYGYEQYEISNYAKPGRACRHNLGYWTGVPYLGLGIGAASAFAGERFSNTRDYERYLVTAGTSAAREEVSAWDTRAQMEEMMFLGLRLTGGVSEETFYRRFGKRMEEVYGPVIDRYADWGLLIREGGFVRLSERGMDVSNAIMADFLLEDTDEQ